MYEYVLCVFVSVWMCVTMYKCVYLYLSVSVSEYMCKHVCVVCVFNYLLHTTWNSESTDYLPLMCSYDLFSVLASKLLVLLRDWIVCQSGGRKLHARMHRIN